MIDSRRDGDLVAEVPRKLEHADARVGRCETRQLLKRVIAAPVVDEQDLVIDIREACQGCSGARMEGTDHR